MILLVEDNMDQEHIINLLTTQWTEDTSSCPFAFHTTFIRCTNGRQEARRLADGVRLFDFGSYCLSLPPDAFDGRVGDLPL